MNEEPANGATFEEFCAALRGQLRRSGFCKEAADAIMTAARSRCDWTSSPPPFDVPPEARPALQALRTVWSKRCADALRAIVRLEADIHYMNFGFGPPPGAKTTRPDWLRPIDDGKADGAPEK